jgi:hypothetical protein
MAARWSAEQDRVLRRLYASGCPIQHIATRVGRSPDAVVARRRALSVAARPRARPWSADEESFLHAAITGGIPVSVIAARLDRSRDQLRARSRHLVAARRPPRPYLPYEDEAIRRCVLMNGDLGRLALRLARSPGAVRVRAQQFGLLQPRRRPRWEPWEDVTVRDGYTSALTCVEIAGQLQHRTPGSVAARARALGLSTYARRWSAGDDQRLAKMSARGVPLEQAALRLGRTPEAVRRRAARRGIPAPPPAEPSRTPRRWTAQEDQLLRLHRALNPAQLAQLLHRSDRAVCRRLGSLGLRRQAARSPHYTISRPQGRVTPGERNMLKRELAGTPRRRIAALRRLENVDGLAVATTGVRLGGRGEPADQEFVIDDVLRGD